MNYKKIMEIIKNEGATLDKNYNNFNSDKGYMVSIKGQEVKVNVNNIEEIKKEIEKKREFIGNKKGLFIGLWLDNDIMYIRRNHYERTFFFSQTCRRYFGTQDQSSPCHRHTYYQARA